MSDRIKKINELIKQRVADIFIKELSFKDALITVQNVDTSKDLRNTKIKISVIPIKRSEEILKILKKQTNRIQNELGKVIEIKFTPEIRFEIDIGEQKTARVEEILKEI